MAGPVEQTGVIIACPRCGTDDGWAFLLPSLLLVREDAGTRQHSLRELFHALRYVVRTGCTWRYLPPDLPPWAACYQQWARWRDARVFDTYAGEQVGAGKKSIALRLEFRSPERTLTDEDVAAARQSIVPALAAQAGRTPTP